MIRAGAFCVLLSALPLGAETLSLSPPIACDLEKDCHIQQYVDHDPGPGVTDFTCGSLSYDGHKGTDFALPSLARMQEGVDVLASAAGRVVAIRDGMADMPFTGSGDVDGKECGNGVLLRHEGGWETQYCHLQEGSVIVAKGQSVATGDVLGRVGLSGKTQFPHVHLSVRHNGAVIDPFAPTKPSATTCTPPIDLAAAPTLWAAPLAYEPGGLISLGFASAVPAYDAIKAGTAAAAVLPTAAPALVLWAHAYGSRPGDALALTIDAPDGPWFAIDVVLDKAQAQYFRAAGRKSRAPLPPGTWRGTVILLRDGQEIDRRETQITVQ